MHYLFIVYVLKCAKINVFINFIFYISKSTGVTHDKLTVTLH